MIISRVFLKHSLIIIFTVETTPGVFYQVFSGGEYKVRGRKRNVGRLEQADSDQGTGTGTGCKNEEIIQNKSTRCHSCARQGSELSLDELRGHTWYVV